VILQKISACPVQIKFIYISFVNLLSIKITSYLALTEVFHGPSGFNRSLAGNNYGCSAVWQINEWQINRLLLKTFWRMAVGELTSGFNMGMNSFCAVLADY